MNTLEQHVCDLLLRSPAKAFITNHGITILTMYGYFKSDVLFTFTRGSLSTKMLVKLSLLDTDDILIKEHMKMNENYKTVLDFVNSQCMSGYDVSIKI
jgi:hypothetical protein